MSRMQARIRDFARSLLDDLNFMMTSRSATVRALRGAFLVASTWFALSVVVLITRCSA